MMKRLVLAAAALTLVTGFLPAGTAQTVAPVSATPAGPVFNPGFEAGPMAGPAADVLEGTPADHCYGVGHQVFWGDETPQGQATGGQFNPYDIGTSQKPDPTEADPQGAVATVQDDPEGEARFLAGQGHCVYGSDTGYDLAWIHPVERAQQPAHWSMDIRSPAVEWDYGFDDDPFDREAKLLSNESVTDRTVAHHNMWQWFGSPHQAWTPNAEALTLTIEDGDPTNGIVRLSLTPMPLGAQGAHYYHDCSLVWTAQQLAADAGTDGVAEVSPLEASFNSHSNVCQDLKQKWDNGDDADKRDVLGRTRITQLSFWGWERNDHHVVVDDVQILGATTAAEEAARGSAQVNPTPVGDEVGLLVCSGHTQDDWSAGVRVDLANTGVDLVLPAPEDVRDEALSLANHLVEHGTFGNSVTHVSVDEDGEETAGAGTDDIPGLTSGNGGGDGGWTCGPDGTQHPDDGGGAPAKPYDNVAEALDDLLP